MEDVSTHIFIINCNLLLYQCQFTFSLKILQRVYPKIYSIFCNHCLQKKKNLTSGSSPKETKKRQFKALTQQGQCRNELTGYRLSP